MADFHSVTVFGVDRITISKDERDDHKWVSINLGGGCSITVFKNSTSTDWPQVVVERSEGEYEVMLSREPATEVQDVYGNITTHPNE